MLRRLEEFITRIYDAGFLNFHHILFRIFQGEEKLLNSA